VSDIGEISRPFDGSQERRRSPDDVVLVSRHPNYASVGRRREIFDCEKNSSNQDFKLAIYKNWNEILAYPSTINGAPSCITKVVQHAL
jgi:hypothetical protein